VRQLLSRRHIDPSADPIRRAGLQPLPPMSALFWYLFPVFAIFIHSARRFDRDGRQFTLRTGGARPNNLPQIRERVRVYQHASSV
jgi:hypothetical protein